MIPERGKIQILVECRNCRRREVIRVDTGESWSETTRGIVKRYGQGFGYDHTEINPENGCNNLSIFDLIAISRRHEEDPE